MVVRKGEGNGDVRMPVIEVEVPLTLPFAVNPYKLNLREDETNHVTDQIWSDNYTIVNYSEVPVAVKTESYAVAGTDVELGVHSNDRWNNYQIYRNYSYKKKRTHFLVCNLQDYYNERWRV